MKPAYVLTVSHDDRQDALKVINEDKVFLLPNGIDVQGRANFIEHEPRPFQLSFIGKMDYRPNVLAMKWFCQSVLPQLQVLQPDLRLSIVGRDPTPEISELQSLRGVTSYRL